MFPKIFKALIFAALAAGCLPNASAEAAAPDPRNFDATGFGSFVRVGSNWLFYPGDNPAWASPAFDDSSWKTISTEVNLPDAGFRDIPYAWYRIHIHLRPGTRNLAVALEE
jgi:hypothetical protein